MSLLPNNILHEILSWLPVKSLLRFRSTSQFWLNLISSPIFIKSHLKQSIQTKNNLNLIISCLRHKRDDFSCLYRVDFDSLEGNDILQLVEINDNPLRNLVYKNIIWGSCDGILCLSNIMKADLLWNPSTGITVGPLNHSLMHENEELICIVDNIDIVVLWNPSTTIYIELPFSPIEIEFSPIEIENERICHEHGSYGFGYDSTNDDYKVVRVMVVFNLVIDYEVKVYSLRSNSWHKVDNFPNQYPDLNRPGNSVAGGAMHWMSVDADGKHSILAFDIGLETYRVIRQPEYRDLDFYSCMASLGGCLSLICHHFSGNVDVWLLRQYGVENEFWSRLITLTQNIPNTPIYFVECVAYSKNGKKVLLKMGYKDLAWYNLEMRSLEDIRFHSEEDSFEDIDSCLESLVFGDLVA